MATLAELRTEILDAAGLASDDPRFDDATLNRIVRSAVRILESEGHWPWLETSETITTAAATEAYTPTAGWHSTIRLSYEDRDLTEFRADDAIRYANDSGAPVGYYIEEDQIHLVPVPDGVYSVTHIYEASLVDADLDADGESASVPDRYIDWLVQIALVKVAQRIRDPELYGMADRERRRWFDRAHDEVERSTGSMMPRSRSDWSI